MSHTRFWLRTALASAALMFTTTSALAAPERLCDCADNDRDGLIDEGTDCLYAGTIEATADDTYDLYLDGAHLGGDGSWSLAHTYGFNVPAGRHVLAVEANDVGYQVQGFLARVLMPIGVNFETGDGVWQMTSNAPPAGWQVTGAGNYTADSALACANTSTWGNNPPSLQGADWVWAGGCRPAFHPRQNYGVATLDVCGEATVCCDVKEGGTASLTATECAEVGTPTGADACVEVCCGLEGSAETVTAAECDALGGRTLGEEMCEEVCCAWHDGGNVTVSAYTCDFWEYETIEDRFCEESCDCRDNDNDGAVDERIDCTYDGALRITADDTYTAYLDGALLGSNGNWSVASDYSFAVTAGRHTIAVEARDLGYSVQGLLARVFAPLGAPYDTGAGHWNLSNVAPAAGWHQTGAGLPINDANAICASGQSNTWGNNPQSLQGADWVWPASCSPYHAPRQLYGATTFDACVEATVCCQGEAGTQALPAGECDGVIVEAERCEAQPCDPILCIYGYAPVDSDGDGCDDRCVPDRRTPIEGLEPALMQPIRSR